MASLKASTHPITVLPKDKTRYRINVYADDDTTYFASWTDDTGKPFVLCKDTRVLPPSKDTRPPNLKTYFTTEFRNSNDFALRMTVPYPEPEKSVSGYLKWEPLPDASVSVCYLMPPDRTLPPDLASRNYEFWYDETNRAIRPSIQPSTGDKKEEDLEYCVCLNSSQTNNILHLGQIVPAGQTIDGQIVAGHTISDSVPPHQPTYFQIMRQTATVVE